MVKLSIDGLTVLDDLNAVIFDKDGTLIDVHHYWASMIEMRVTLIIEKWFSDVYSNDISDSLIEAMGVNVSSRRIKPDGPVGIKPRPFIVDVAGRIVRLTHIDVSNAEIEEVFGQVDRLTSTNMLPILRLLPSVERLLEELKKFGIIMMIATTDQGRRARIAMKALGIEHFFSEIVGADSVELTKPSPDLALMLIERCDLDKSKTIMIGDHPVDVLMGVAAELGVNIGVLTGVSSASVFSELECFSINDLSSIQVGD